MDVLKRQSIYLAFSMAVVACQAQTIFDVVNFGSRIGTGLPSSGIAQGALFSIVGSAVGPAQAIQAAFPLPATDGLSGVTVSLTASDGSSVNAILVAASPNEVDAILPSATPLGPATLTLNNSGSAATWNINVVGSAFGIFSGAGIYNISADGSTMPNTNFQSAQPGQIVLISGTGLGAIPSDETQSGVTDVPATTITVWVGTQQATVVSAARGICCTGIDPNFPIPLGTAAWDVIAFVVPAGVSGCAVSIAVQTPASVSNFANFAVAVAGGTCPEAVPVNGGNPIVVTGLTNQGTINLVRSDLLAADGSETKTDSAQALFTSTDYGGAQVTVPSYLSILRASAGSCYVSTVRSDSAIAGSGQGSNPPTPTFLDAGFALNLTAPKVTELMPQDGNGQYSAVSSVVSYLQPGPPSISSGGPGFLAPGTFRLDDSGGGVDIGAFQEILQNPTPVSWDSMAQNLTVDHSQGLTVNWSGGDPNGVLSIGGNSSSTVGTVTYTGTFGCTAPISTGTFTVPAFVTGQLPLGTANMSLTQEISQTLQDIPGVSVAYYFSRNITGAIAILQD